MRKNIQVSFIKLFQWINEKMIFYSSGQQISFCCSNEASEPHKEIKITLFIVWLIGYNQKQKVESSKLSHQIFRI